MSLVVSFDESGNSGGNLLDAAQPVYVVAATHLSDAEAADLLRLHGLDHANEAHFKNLRRRPAGQRRVLALLESLSPGAAGVSVTHKPFMVVAKIVDDLVEAAMHEDGFNLYEGGGHIALANLFHFTLPVFHPAEFGALLKRFVALARNPTHDHIEQFFASCRRIRQATDHDGTASIFRRLESLRGDVVSLLSKEYPLDPCLTAFVALTSSYERDESGAARVFEVNYDDTPVMKAQQKLLAKYCDQSRGPAVIGAGERSYRLPLPVDPLRFVQSEEHPAVQVADLVASSVAYWIRAIGEGFQGTEFHDELRRLTHGFVVHAVWPDADAIGRRDESFVGVDPPSDAARWLFHGRP